MPIWLVSGPPGAGKTSVAEALCGRFERAVHIPVDGSTTNAFWCAQP